VSGTWANSVFFQDSDAPAPAASPQGFQSVLTRGEWKGVVDFAHAVNTKIVTSFAISAGVRDASGIWTPDQARRFLAYTGSVGGSIAAAEFFNEPSFATMGGAPPDYDAAGYARDFSAFREFARAAAPDMLIVGPGSVGEGIRLVPGTLLQTADLLAAYPRPVFDIFRTTPTRRHRSAAPPLAKGSSARPRQRHCRTRGWRGRRCCWTTWRSAARRST
jgi:heparanase